MNEERTKSRRRLVFLAALFLGPLALAWLLYFGAGGWRPTGSAAHGELIQPPVALADVSPRYLLGDAPDGLFRKTWSLAVMGADACTERCLDALVKIRQIRLTLGKDMDRIGRVLAVSADERQIPAIAEQHPGLVVVASEGDMRNVIASFPGAMQGGEWIYVVDPLGNLMMRFPSDIDSHDIREDLKRLLRLSRIG